MEAPAAFVETVETEPDVGTSPGTHGAWVFTFNNFSEGDFTHFKNKISFSGSICNFGIVGREVGANGTHHLQGYVEVKRKCKWEKIRDYFGNNFWFKAARGTAAENITYCSKQDSNPWRHGEANPKYADEILALRNGTAGTKRKGVSSEEKRLAVKLAKEGKLDQIDDEILYDKIIQLQAIKRYFYVQAPEARLEEINSWWIQGPTGLGKTFYVGLMSVVCGLFIITDEYFNAYRNGNVMLMDECGSQTFDTPKKVNRFKEFSGQDVFAVQMKYEDSRQIRPPAFYCLSNKALWQCLNSGKVQVADAAAIKRRLKVVNLFNPRTAWEFWNRNCVLGNKPESHLGEFIVGTVIDAYGTFWKPGQERPTNRRYFSEIDCNEDLDTIASNNNAGAYFNGTVQNNQTSNTGLI